MRFFSPTLVAASLLALSFAAPAADAAVRSGTYVAPKGKIQLGYDFKFKVSKGKIHGLVANVLENCSGSATSTVTTVAPDSSWKIRNGRFSGRIKETYADGDLTAYYTLEGRFKGNKAVGTLRAETIVNGTTATCDTYKLKFTALRR